MVPNMPQDESYSIVPGPNLTNTIDFIHTLKNPILKSSPLPDGDSRSLRFHLSHGVYHKNPRGKLCDRALLRRADHEYG